MLPVHCVYLSQSFSGSRCQRIGFLSFPLCFPVCLCVRFINVPSEILLVSLRFLFLFQSKFIEVNRASLLWSFYKQIFLVNLAFIVCFLFERLSHRVSVFLFCCSIYFLFNKDFYCNCWYFCFCLCVQTLFHTEHLYHQAGVCYHDMLAASPCARLSGCGSRFCQKVQKWKD